MKKKIPVCLSPHYSLTINPNGLSPCCHLSEYSSTFNYGDYLNEMRLFKLKVAHLDNRVEDMPSPCHNCLKNPNLTTYGFMSNRDGDMVNAYLDNQMGIRHLIITDDIKCGYSCSMCVSSDKKLDDWEYLGEREIAMGMRKDNTLDVFQLLEKYQDTIQYISLAGGDPTLSQRTIKILEWVTDRKGIKLFYHHNGQNNTLTDGSSLWERLSKITDVCVLYSIDSIPTINEFSRVGFKQKRFDKMVDEGLTYLPNANHALMVTLSVLALPYIAEAMLYFEEEYISRGIGISFSLVNNPAWHGANTLPNQLRLSIIKKLKGLSLNHDATKQGRDDVIKYLSSSRYNPTLWSKFMLERKRLDSLHGKDTLELIPEFAKYWMIEK